MMRKCQQPAQSCQHSPTTLGRWLSYLNQKPDPAHPSNSLAEMCPLSPRSTCQNFLVYHEEPLGSLGYATVYEKPSISPFTEMHPQDHQEHGIFGRSLEHVSVNWERQASTLRAWREWSCVGIFRMIRNRPLKPPENTLPVVLMHKWVGQWVIHPGTAETLHLATSISTLTFFGNCTLLCMPPAVKMM